MSSTTESQIKYAGNGVQVLFTFPFTYLQPTDIYVSLYNQTERRWDDTTQWTFANATTIQFTTAPPTATGEVTDNIRIQRRTSIDPLVAQFNPGSAIRASDLNDDFEQLQLAIIDNSSAVNNLDVGVTSLTTEGTGLSVDQSTGNITISNTGVTAVNAGNGISIDQSTGSVTITSTKVSDVTSVNGQTGDVSLDINDLTDVDTKSPGHVPSDGQALIWDSGMNHWMPADVVAESSVPEAPEDNKVYGRENAEWVVIADGETGPVLSVNNQTGAVSIGVEELTNFKEYTEGVGTRPVSEAYPTYVPDGAPGGLQLTQWAYQNPGNNNSTIILCTTSSVWSKYLDDIKVGDSVTFNYQRTSLSGLEYATETGTVLNRFVDGQNLFHITTTASFANHIPSALIFTHNVPTSGAAPDGSVLQWSATDNKWTPGFNTVEQLADFAYYPASQQVTLVGPMVADLNTPSATNSEYVAFITGDDMWIKYLATNTALNEVFKQLTVGDDVTACYYTNDVSDNSIIYVEMPSTFKSFGPNNNDPNPTENRLTLTSSLFSAYPPKLGDYQMVIKSPYISNGFEPITTGQALIYDVATQKWRPEDVTLNISSYPTLPSN